MRDPLSAPRRKASGELGRSRRRRESRRAPMMLAIVIPTGKLYEVRTARVLELTAHAALGRATQALPLLSNCFVPRAVLGRIRDQFGSICDSTAPDMSFLYRFCAIEDRYIYSDTSAGIIY